MRYPLLLLALAATPASAADFLDDPKALCGQFEAQGMKAQMRWGQPQPGGPWFCQYADEFSSHTTHVRAAQVYVDPKKRMVGVGLSIQALPSSSGRGQSAELLAQFAVDFYAAQGRSVPAGLEQMVTAPANRSLKDGALDLGTSDDYWESQRVLGLQIKRSASAAQMAALAGSVTPKERAAAGEVKKRLEARCDAAVAKSGEAGEAAGKLKKKSTQLSASRYLVELSDAEGTFFCQVCDDDDPGVNCGTMGLTLSYTSKAGERLTLPAELDRKCAFYLQKETMAPDSGRFIDHDIVRRITTREIKNDKRYLFEHELDGELYRCVVRKSDLNFTLEQKMGEEQWRAIATGILM